MPFSQLVPSFPEGDFAATLLRSVHDVVAAVDGAGKVLFVNAAAAPVLGHAPDELVGRSFLDYVHEADRDALRQAFDRLASEEGRPGDRGDGFHQECRFRHLDGSWRDLETTGRRPVAAPPPAGRWLVLTVRDVTERKRRLQVALKAGAMGVWRVDLRTARAHWDDQVQRLHGWPPGTFPGTHDAFLEHIHPDDLTRVRDFSAVVDKEKREFTLQFRVRWPDGTVLWLEERGTPDFDARGEVVAITGTTVDVTAHKERERQFRARAQQQRAVALLGRSALAGATPDELRRQTVDLVAETLDVRGCGVWERDGATHGFALRAAARGGVADAGAGAADADPGEGGGVPADAPGLLGALVRDDGQPVVAPDLRGAGIGSAGAGPGAVSVTAVPLAGETGRPPEGVLAVFDLPGRRCAEEEVVFLQALANTLAAALKRCRDEEALRQEKERAQRAEAAKGEFLSRVSHELRTPLNAVLGFGQLLQLDLGAGTSRAHESVGLIVKAGRHLLGLVDELLDLARLEHDHPNLVFVPVAVEPLLRETADLVRPLAAEHDVELRLAPATPESGPAVVRADRQRLQQVLLNLLSNAIRYNRPGGTVELRSALAARAEEGAGPRVRLIVRDTGVGISAECLERLGTPFDRLEAACGPVAGTGLGLAVSRQLTRSLGGTLGVESAVGRGSTFWVELPCEPSPAGPEPSARPGPSGRGRGPESDAAPEPAAAPEPGGANRAAAAAAAPEERAGPLLLCVEDNVSNQRLVETLLARCRPDLRVLMAVDGARGLEAARRHRPDLILLDLHLPDLDGDAVLAGLREEPATRDIPVILLSADANPHSVERLLAAGAHAYVTKPLDVRRLLDLIQEVLGAPRPPARAALQATLG